MPSPPIRSLSERENELLARDLAELAKMEDSETSTNRSNFHYSFTPLKHDMTASYQLATASRVLASSVLRGEKDV